MLKITKLEGACVKKRSLYHVGVVTIMSQYALQTCVVLAGSSHCGKVPRGFRVI